MPVAAPRWEWKWNPNTVLFLIAIAGGILSWGYAVARWEGAIKELTNRILVLETRSVAADAAGRGRERMLDNHDLRIANMEKRADEAATAMNAINQAISELASDMRVTREIVQRIEASQNGRRSSH